MLTGGTASDGDCRTSDGGCCDLVPECRDDGTCQLPPPVCTTDSTCDGVGEICARGLACVSADDLVVVAYDPDSSPYMGVVRYDSRDLFLVGTGDFSEGSYTLTEVVTFVEEEEGYNLHVLVDGSGLPISAYVEGREDEVFTYVYDDNGNLVSLVEPEDSSGRKRGLRLSTPSGSSVIQDVIRRELLAFLPFVAAGIIIGIVVSAATIAMQKLADRFGLVRIVSRNRGRSPPHCVVPSRRSVTRAFPHS